MLGAARLGACQACVVTRQRLCRSHRHLCAPPLTIAIPQTPQAAHLDPVIGRDDEIRRVIRILSRRTKNNPVLVGEVRWLCVCLVGLCVQCGCSLLPVHSWVARILLLIMHAALAAAYSRHLLSHACRARLPPTAHSRASARLPLPRASRSAL